MNQAIGGQSLLYRFFRESLGCDDSSIRKIELSYFAMSVLSTAYLVASRDPRRTETLDIFSQRLLQRALKATSATQSYGAVVATYQSRFGEYQSLLRSVLDRNAPKTPDPAVTLLIHAYERVTDSSAASSMVHIMVGGKIARQFVADQLAFVRQALPDAVVPVLAGTDDNDIAEPIRSAVKAALSPSDPEVPLTSPTWNRLDTVRAILRSEARGITCRLLDLLEDEEDEFSDEGFTADQATEFRMLANALVVIAALDTASLNPYEDAVTKFLNNQDEELVSVTNGSVSAHDAQQVAASRFQEYHAILTQPVRTHSHGIGTDAAAACFARHASLVPGLAARATSPGAITFLNRRFLESCKRFQAIESELQGLETKARTWLEERANLPDGYQLGYGSFGDESIHISPRISPWDPDCLEEPLRTVVIALEHEYPSRLITRAAESNLPLDVSISDTLIDDCAIQRVSDALNDADTGVPSSLGLKRDSVERLSARTALPPPTLGPDRSTPYEQLAAILAFSEAESREPVFYREHHDPLDFAAGFIAHLAGRHSILADAFVVARRDPSLVGAAQTIEWAVHSGVVSERDLEWIDRQMTEVLRYLLALVLRAGLPPNLRDAALAVKGAFEAPDPLAKGDV